MGKRGKKKKTAGKMSRMWLGLTPMPPHGKRTNMGLAEPGNEKTRMNEKKGFKKKINQ